MKIKKLLTTIGLGASLTVSAIADTGGTHVWRSIPLLSGYNVLIPSNGVVGSALLPQSGATNAVQATNVLYTKYNGQIVYAYSNNFNGGMSSNSLAGDAFQPASLVADANADINANATFWLILGNTNYLPIVATNSQGQLVVPSVSTNGLFAYNAGPNPVLWPLAVNSGPSWMVPGSTNFYPQFPGTNGTPPATTNLLFVNLYRAPGPTITGGLGNDLNAKVPMYESAPIVQWNVAFVGNGNTPQVLVTNLPTSVLQGGRDFVMTIGFTNSTYQVGTNLVSALLNQAFLMQPQ